MLKSVPVKANIRQQFDIFRNLDTWLMTLLYIMTFGTFSGLAAQFGLLMANLYGSGNADIVEGSGATATVLVAGYAVPDVVKYVFLGPLVGAAARVLFSPLTDRTGGARWTLISGIGLIASIAYTIPALTPDTSSAATLEAGFDQFLYGMIAIFLFSGIGNASTFKQMPMIFERRQAGGVIGWTAAIAAFGPFFFGIGVTTLGPVALLRDRHRLGDDVRGHHVVALRASGRTQAQLTEPLDGQSTASSSSRSALVSTSRAATPWTVSSV